MKIVDSTSAALRLSGRLDARYFVDGSAELRTRLETGSLTRSIADMGTATMPLRIKKVPATSAEEAVPYLRPYDVFEYLPPDSDRISVGRTRNVGDYRIREGDILQTRSGRNLGPVTMADSYLARFVVSDDMIRIRIDDEQLRLYTFAFLRCPTGQRVLRGELGGSVISHISPEQVAKIRVPFDDEVMPNVVEMVRRATALRGRARETLCAAVAAINTRFTLPANPAGLGWTVPASALRDRLDAAFHSAPISDARVGLTQQGGIPMSSVAEVVKPAGRHKMVYVDVQHGTPLLSGRQVLQADVVACKHLSRHSAQAAGGFDLQVDTVVFQADGRSEEGLGYPAMVTADRDGWLASGHVGRLVPFDPADAGWLWASMASDIVQAQVGSLSCGSVVDALYPDQMTGVMLPPKELVDSARVRQAWVDMSQASELLAQVSALMEASIERAEARP